MAFIKEKKFRISSVIENLLPSGLFDGEPERTEISPDGFLKISEGEYEITEKADGDLQITFTYPTDNKDEVIKGGTFDFEEGDGYIKIGVAKYTKLDK